ncbi:MAG: hypothetical protein JWO85_560, partial [Candidatus Eremiobacteraeota bacterium]|nr:hypothetical protein [Candidatus Eremiobacteraeota bacterium]
MAAATLLLEAYELAQAARARGDRFVRILVEPKRRYAERYVRLWDSVLGKRIDRHLVAEEQNG